MDKQMIQTAIDRVVYRLLHLGGADYDADKTALAAAWILRHPAGMQVIAGTTNPDRLSSVCRGAELELSREDWYRLYKAAGNHLP